jgi:hypothetical protein
MNEGAFLMFDIHSTSPGEDEEHHLVPWRFSRFSSRDSFFGFTVSFFYPILAIVYGRAMLAMEGKSVVPMSVPVSIYGYPGL